MLRFTLSSRSTIHSNSKCEYIRDIKKYLPRIRILYFELVAAIRWNIHCHQRAHRIFVRSELLKDQLIFVSPHLKNQCTKQWSSVIANGLSRSIWNMKTVASSLFWIANRIDTEMSNNMIDSIGDYKWKWQYCGSFRLHLLRWITLEIPKNEWRSWWLFWFWKIIWGIFECGGLQVCRRKVNKMVKKMCKWWDNWNTVKIKPNIERL